jgi:tetratricopeptide (TPR) repeat protein
MKIIKIALIAMFVVSATLIAQSNTDKLKDAYENQDLVAAEKLIPGAMAENPKDYKLAVLCGDIYFQMEKYKEALDMYKKADDLEGGEPEIMRKVGRANSYLGKHDEAVKVLKNTIKKDEKDVYSVLELAYAYIKADSLKQAELMITRAREMNKKIPDAYIALGDLYFAQRVYALARENYEEALSLDDKLIEARTKLAISYYWLANKEIDEDLANELFTRSLKEWNVITQQNPKDARAWFEQGRILFFSRKYELAAKSLYEYSLLRPEGYLGRWYLAQSLYELGQNDSAVVQLAIVAKNIDSVRIKATKMMARAYFDTKKSNESFATYLSIKDSVHFDNIETKRFAATALSVGDTVKFIDLISEAIEKYPTENCKEMYSIGKTLIKLKKYDKASSFLLKRLSTPECKDSLEAEVRYWLGVSVFLAERPEEQKMAKMDSAMNHLQSAIAINPNLSLAYVYIADIYAAKGDLKNAEDNFNKAIQSASADTSLAESKQALNQAYSKYCGLKLDAKKYTDIVKLASEWAKYFPDSIYPYLYQAIGYQAQGDKDSACKFYRKVLQIDPKNATAKKYLTDLGC